MLDSIIASIPKLKSTEVALKSKNSIALIFFLRLLAKLPLPVLHFAGIFLGWLIYLSSKKYAFRLKSNIKNSGLANTHQHFRKLLRENIAESGKSSLETIAIWLNQDDPARRWVKDCEGIAHIQAAQANGRGILFLTPHLGCYEITSLFYGLSQPITVLYRPPKQRILQPLIEQGRQRGLVKLAAANSSGVRSLMQALKRGEAIGILPDQVPASGEGEWAPFFGQAAYTMTLASKIAIKTQANILLAFGERLSYGRGYIIHVKPLSPAEIGTPALLNLAIADLIRTCPAQYLWSYNRYKTPTLLASPELHTSFRG